MTTDKIMELVDAYAQEAKDYGWTEATGDMRDKITTAIDSLIAKSESEPVAWMVYFDSRLGGARITDKLLVWRKGQAKEHVKEDLIQKIEPLYTKE